MSLILDGTAGVTGSGPLTGLNATAIPAGGTAGVTGLVCAWPQLKG